METRLLLYFSRYMLEYLKLLRKPESPQQTDATQAHAHTCAAHARPCELFCLGPACLAPLCPGCPLHEHRGHRLVGAREALCASAREEGLLGRCGELQGAAAALAAEVKVAIDRLQRGFEVSKQQVVRRRKTLIQQIIAQSEAVLRNMEVTRKDHVEHLEKVKRELDRCAADMEHVGAEVLTLPDAAVGDVMETLVALTQRLSAGSSIQQRVAETERVLDLPCAEPAEPTSVVMKPASRRMRVQLPQLLENVRDWARELEKSAEQEEQGEEKPIAITYRRRYTHPTVE